MPECQECQNAKNAAGMPGFFRIAWIAGPALGRVLNDARDADGFCLKKINNISGILSY